MGFLDVAFDKNEYESSTLKGFDDEAISQKHDWSFGGTAGQRRRRGGLWIGGEF